MSDSTGTTIRLRNDRFEKLEKAAIKLTIEKQQIVKVSEILHRLVDEYLDDVLELYKTESKENKKSKKKA